MAKKQDMDLQMSGAKVKLGKSDIVIRGAGYILITIYAPVSYTHLKTEEGKYKTNADKIFVTGDMHRGQSLVVWAIREGREAAREVDESLMGYTNVSPQ